MLLGGLVLPAQVQAADAPQTPDRDEITIVPLPSTGPLRNPLMGITARELGVNEWSTLTHHYIGWRELERTPEDGVQKIVDFCNVAWRGLPEKNMKVIPRVYLEYPGRPNAWPDGLADGDYTSPEFARRLVRFVEKLGQAWDHDPRVAFIELGIFGRWGEHHSPGPSAEMQRIAGAAFARAFPDKCVSVRRAWETFPDGNFGEYWDSFAHWDEMATNGRPIAQINAARGLYKHAYIGGEVAYDWGNWRIQPGETPTISLAEPAHLDYVLNTVHWLQCTQIRWIGDYDCRDARAAAGAAKLQSTLGYRFILEGVRYTTSLLAGGRLHVEISVRNTGSAPFYYRWPLEVSLLDESSHRVVWHETFKDVDIREWLPGQSKISPQWTSPAASELPRAIWPSFEIKDWCNPPQTYRVSGDFTPAVPPGRYVLALAILDPAGMVPAVGFATRQYWRGGRHPIGFVGVGGAAGGKLPENTTFDDQLSDQTLRYDPGAITQPGADSGEK